MKYTLKDWEFSNTEMPEEPENKGFKMPKEGDWYLQILDAIYDRSQGKYIIKVYDLNNEVEFTLTYFMMNKNGEKNYFSFQTLKSLGQAIFFGADITIPNPDDIRGAAVMGRVKLKEVKNEDEPEKPPKKFARIYEFFPVPEDIAEGFGKHDEDGNIAQYYEGATE